MKVVETELQNKGKITIRIKDGAIISAGYKKKTSVQTTEGIKESVDEIEVLPKEDNFQSMVEIWMKDILKADIEKFKEIVIGIEDGSPEVYSYCVNLLEKEKEKKIKIIREVNAEYNRRLKALEDDLNRYMLPKK